MFTKHAQALAVSQTHTNQDASDVYRRYAANKHDAQASRECGDAIMALAERLSLPLERSGEDAKSIFMLRCLEAIDNGIPEEVVNVEGWLVRGCLAEAKSTALAEAELIYVNPSTKRSQRRRESESVTPRAQFGLEGDAMDASWLQGLLKSEEIETEEERRSEFDLLMDELELSDEMRSLALHLAGLGPDPQLPQSTMYLRKSQLAQLLSWYFTPRDGEAAA